MSSVKVGDVKVGNKIDTGVRVYTITHELDENWVAYSYVNYGEVKFGASRKTDFAGRGYTLILPFFELGKKYRYFQGGETVYTVDYVTEKEGVKVALVWYRSSYSNEILWTYFDESEFKTYKLDS